jgi:hypothetical protein
MSVNYYWPKLSGQVSYFMRIYVVCQRFKKALSNARFYTPILVLDALWLKVSMDFYVPLTPYPMSHGFYFYYWLPKDDSFHSMLEDHGCILDSLPLF